MLRAHAWKPKMQKLVNEVKDNVVINMSKFLDMLC